MGTTIVKNTANEWGVGDNNRIGDKRVGGNRC